MEKQDLIYLIDLMEYNIGNEAESLKEENAMYLDEHEQKQAIANLAMFNRIKTFVGNELVKLL